MREPEPQLAPRCRGIARRPARLTRVLSAAVAISSIVPVSCICDKPTDIGKTQVVSVEYIGYQLQVLCGDDAEAAAGRAATKRKTAITDGKEVRSLVGKFKKVLDKKAPDYTPPAELREGSQTWQRTLRTAGAYSRRAAQHTRNQEFGNAIADLLRALLRPGLDPTANDKLSATLQDTLKKAEQHRVSLANEGDLSELFEAFDIEDNVESLDEVEQGPLKRLYRQLSVKFHPDKSPANAPRFNKIRDAYEILSDPVKVMLYDTGGIEIVRKFEGGKDLERTDNVEKEARVTLADIYGGLTKNITINRQIVCRSCRMNPKLPRCKKCSRCPSEVQHQQVWLNQFEYTVQEVEIPSPEKCARSQTSFNVVIERGMLAGDRVTHPMKADQKPKAIPGDVLVSIKVDKHPYFKRVQNDLVVTVRVSLYEALLGFERELVHLDGHIVKFGMDKGEVLRPKAGLEIQGEGMPLREDPSSYGRLLVMFEIEFPKTMTDEAAAKLESAFADLGMGKGDVRLKGRALKSEL